MAHEEKASLVNVGYVEDLAKIMQQNNIGKIKVKEGEKTVELIKVEAMGQATASVVANPIPQQQPLKEQKNKATDSVDGKKITSPMVGTFYDSSSPEADPFVQKGSRVKKGDILCIIEAMKMLNHIKAESSGEILEIKVENGQGVEFGQALFIVSND